MWNLGVKSQEVMQPSVRFIQSNFGWTFASVCKDGRNLVPTLHSRVKLVASGQQPANHATGTWQCSIFRYESCLSTRQSIATVTWPNWCVWRRKLRKNNSILRRKKCSLTKTRHHLIVEWKQLQNYTSNCFRTHLILNLGWRLLDKISMNM